MVTSVLDGRGLARLEKLDHARALLLQGVYTVGVWSTHVLVCSSIVAARVLLHCAFHLFSVLVFSTGKGKIAVDFGVWSLCYFFHALVYQHGRDFIRLSFFLLEFLQNFGIIRQLWQPNSKTITKELFVFVG